MSIKSNFLDRLIKRLDLLDSKSVKGWLLKLVREKGLLDTIFQTIQEGVLIIDRDLKILWVNDAAIRMLGLPTDIRDRENQKIRLYLKDLDWDQILSQTPEEWGRASRREIEVFYPSHRYLQFFIFPYENEFEESSEPGIATIVLNDVTELRNKAENRIESEKIKSITMLAAGVAHEIGNPLNSLNIHLQLLERHFRNHKSSESDTSEAEEILDVALEEVRRLDTIINQFLKAIRPTQLDLKAISLKDLVSETINFMRKEIEDRGIFVEGSWPKEIPTMLGDPTQLKQAFYNIIINAVQAMGEGGLLKISLGVNDSDIVVTFADSGKGIAPEELGNVFDPYYTTREDGSGLGLMIVERIIRDHDGEFSLESKPGEGTVVTIRFIGREKRTRLLKSSSGN